MRNRLFDGDGLLSTSPACCCQLVKILTTLEPYGIFGSDFAYLSILYCPATGMQNGAEGLPSIILAGRGLLVRMIITLEPQGIL